MSPGERRDLHFLLRVLPAGRRGWLVAGSLLSMLAALSSVGLVAASGWLITASGLAGIAAAGGVAITLEIFAPGALIRLFAVTRTAGRYLERLIVHEAVFRLLSRLRRGLFLEYARRPFAVLRRMEDGPLLARMTGDIGRLEQAHAGLILPLQTALVILVLLVPLLGLMLGGAAASLGLVLLLATMMRLHHHLHRQSPREARQALGEARDQARLNRLLSNHAALYFADPGDVMAAEHRRRYLQYAWQKARNERRALGCDAEIQLFFSLFVIALMPAFLVGNSEVPWLAAGTLAVLAAGTVMAGLGGALSRWGGVRVALHRLRTLRQIEGGDSPPGGKLSAPSWRLSAVTLRRGMTDRPVLDGVNLEIKPGERVLITGPSGTGKSRIARLLAGLETADDGTVWLAERPVTDWPENQRFARISLLEQHSVLLSDSVRSNLVLGNPSLDDEKLMQALKAVGLDRGGIGLDQWIDPYRRPLSGGEARRLVLLRTVLSDTPAVILDEPFRGLNAVDRQAVIDWLEPTLAGKTVVLLDHEPDPAWTWQWRHLRMEGGALQTRMSQSDFPGSGNT
ncbi:amino acid ABC transporter ATP-binding/permease protein [Natronospira bacteriovora]|uniref:ATP-binding cassette domain-containing protein n=1 Tax=Natronospira bacteriovora TaxID=3069753 RepID=A0ABU0W5V8_9GAMM|nr:ATP-binding cassette domain-containing protein [Natronospira sp. AB-CW4]MDQ2068400.1 ATP-binding cassette domain-containing protein [Natronospira sp. AB-CW4]